jgi:hypothetical protein
MQKRNKKRNPIAVQLKHFKHKVIRDKKKYNRREKYERSVV